ncbi:MAG: HAD-IA family hydrolase [Lachnospiraceae bacterium]
MEKKAYIFDLDGTLVDTLDSLEKAVNNTMDRLGFGHVTKMQCREYIGNGARVLVDKSLKSVIGEVQEDLLDHATAIYQEEFALCCTYNVTPYEGIKDLLAELKKQGYVLAVLTNKPHAQAVVAVEEIFGEDTFDLIQGQVDGMPRKPDPKSIDCVLEELNVLKEECIFVGDSEVDVQTGKSAGVFTVGVAWGFRDEDVLRREKADVVVFKALDILEIK